MKSKKPNEIREEVRKQVAAKYKEEIERLKKLAKDLGDEALPALAKLTEVINNLTLHNR